MLRVRIAANSTVDVPGQTYIAYVRRLSDDLYLDFDDDTFKAFGDLVDGDADYVEDVDQPGIWLLNEALPATLTDTIEVITRDSFADALFSLQSLYVVAGDPLVDLARPLVPIHTDTGGFNTLKIQNASGEPIEGATIRVFTKFDFDAGNLDNVIGITASGPDGRWLAPVYVNSGNVYTVLVQKDHVAGPTTIEISV
jgi:hypothetical protein